MTAFGINGNHAVDGVAHDGGDGDMTPTCLGAQATHLLFRQRDLGPDHQEDHITRCDVITADALVRSARPPPTAR